jgi:hypothetical protein
MKGSKIDTIQKRSANILDVLSFRGTTWIEKAPTFSQYLRLKNRVSGTFQAAKVLDINSLIQLGINECAGLSFDARTDLLIFNSELEQVVTKSTKEQLDLLNSGKRVFRSREMMELVVHGDDELLVSSRVVTGSSYSVSNLYSINSTIQLLLNELADINSSLNSIELLHTHPTIDAIFGNEDKLIYLINGLSHADILIAQYISKKYLCKVTIKAISGSGVTYSAVITV